MLSELAVLPTSSRVSGIGIEEILSLVVILLAVVLLVVSLLSYRKTGLMRMLLVSAAFGLFGVRTLFLHFGVFIFNWTAQTVELLSLLMDLVILVLFFLALSSRK
jgi:hypothetical protein